MRKTLILAFLAIPFVGLSKEYKGREANKIYPGSNWVLTNDNTNQVEFIQFAEGKELRVNQIEAWINAQHKSRSYSLELESEFTDQLGIQHKRYSIYSNGISMSYNWLNVHIKNGLAYRLNGKFQLENPNALAPIVNESTALDNALQEVGATLYKWDMPAEEERLKNDLGSIAATYFPYGELTFIKEDLEASNQLKLAWKFTIYAHEPLSRQHIYVDAQNGNILFKENLIHHADVAGTAHTKYSGIQSIVADSYSGGYRLREAGRGNGIRTFNMQQGTSYGSAVDFTDSDNIWNNVNAFQDEAATDAHWGSEMTYDYFDIKHNRNSIDGNGFQLISYVHYDANFDNAFWDGFRMTYGDGSGSTTAFTALDITGHEITHGLTTNTADLIYQNESGALNESFSDIFGVAIEHYARPNNTNWLIGEDIGFVIRSMSNPNQYGDPDCYNGTNWYVGAFDNGGVHINSGVQNFWYYLMVNGGSGTNDIGNAYNVTGIGYDDAASIAFRNLTVYLGQSSDYEDSRFYSILSALDLYGACSNEVETTTNAWYAVGLGNTYVPYVNSDFVASKTEYCTTPAQVQFQNLSSNATSFFWDFGDGATSTTFNPLHTYTDTGYFEVKLVVDGGSCGQDSVTLTDYIYVSPSLPCDVILPTNGTAPTQTSCTGRLLDSGGANGNYGDMESASVTIAPLGATSITLDIISFDVEFGSGSSCDYDYLEVYSGTTTSQSTLIGRYCNTTGIPNSIQVNNGAATILFYSDQSLNHAGFEIEWTCSTPSLPPVTDFYVSAINDCNGEYQFVDQSTNQPSGWMWDFGDGNISTSQNPIHTYAQNGTYNVKLISSNIYGVDSVLKTNVVTVDKASVYGIISDSVCNNESATLSVQTSGTAQWFDSPVGGNLLYSGNTFTTPLLNASTTYYVEDLINGLSQSVGEADNSNSGFYSSGSSNYLVFNAHSDFVLESVTLYTQISGMRNIELRNSAGALVNSTSANLVSGANIVTLDYPIQTGNGYRIGLQMSTLGGLYQQVSNTQYPYTIPGVVSIVSTNNGATTTYPYFYNWQIEGDDCSSDRVAVQAFVDETCWPASVGNISDSDLIRVYPNPFGGQFQVDLSAVENQDAQVKVYTITGQMIYSNKVKTGSVSTIDLNLYAAGTYWLEVQLKEGVYQKQMVKQY